ncbi:MAG: tripartite tricarboxylate transporter substrate binding protein [Acetobacteraceae bacterium]|nr:tripartite tricarboxylate transporter substrate binding protein [Acetobacteraceae bacterium]MDW8398131.1 tripartite tricarboxylate transporter substrate binding protein [Acetobacteraceae bacterium]
MSLSRRALAGLLVAPALLPGLSRAQAWPARPVRIVVPFPPGGTTDVVARLVAARMGERLGQSLVIENRAGAGGTVGSAVVAQSPPDGYTLLVSNVASQGVGPSLYRNLPYNAVTDFTHIGVIAEIPSVLIVNVDRPIRTLAEFIEAARRDPGGIRVASPGNGSSSHIKQVLLNQLAGIQTTHVPYRGSGPALNDVMGNQIEAMITTLQEAGRNPRVRLLAVTSAERMARWPEVPTFRELGYDIVASTWFGLSGPARLPDAIADRLSAELLATLAEPGIAQRLEELGSATRPLTRAQFAAFVAEEVARWAPIVRASGAQPD